MKMISPELVRRYPFFAGLTIEQINTLAMAAEDMTAEAGEFLFHEGEQVGRFFVVVEGAVGIVFEVPARRQEAVISKLGPGDVFAWSGLVFPHKATASAKALTLCRVLSFNFEKICQHFEQDWRFGYLMMEKATRVMRDRLYDLRLESLAYLAE